jgi:hypothetical protein
MTGNDDRFVAVFLIVSEREHVIILSVRTVSFLGSPESRRVPCESLGNGLYWVFAEVGFMEFPNVPRLLQVVACSQARAFPSKPSRSRLTNLGSHAARCSSLRARARGMFCARSLLKE